MELTQEVVRELLDYDPETGLLTWRERDLKWFRSTSGRNAEHAMKQWNLRYARRVAFNVPNGNGYLCGSLAGKKYFAHRIIYLWVTGEWPNVIDHIDGRRDNNRIMNLINGDDVTNSKNKINLSRSRGVSFHKASGKYAAYTSEKGKTIYLGLFETEQEAFAAYVKAAKAAGFTDRHIYGDGH